MVVLGYAAALLMGAVLGLVGGGGSILTVPILVYLLAVEPKMATAYSLFVVGISSLVGAWTYARRRLVDFHTGAVFAVPSFIGVYVVRKYVMPALPSTIFSVGSFSVSQNSFILLVFAVVMVFAAGSMIKKTQTAKSPAPSAPDAGERKFNYPLIGLEGVVVGGVTGFVGAGGGFLIIPALVILAGLEMKIAVGTSLVIIAVKSLVGFLGDVQSNSNMDWHLLLIFTSISIVGIVLGTAMSKKIPSEKLKPAFGWFVLLMGMFILARELLMS